jgi:hypothetical protein
MKTPLVEHHGIVALVRYQGHGINKPFPGYGHLSIVAYVGGSHKVIGLGGDDWIGLALDRDK